MLNIWWNVQYLSRAQQSLCLCCKGNVSKGWMRTPDSNAEMPAQSRQSKRTAALWLALQITWQQVHAISCWSRARALSLHNVQHKGYFFTLPDVLQNVVISSLSCYAVLDHRESDGLTILWSLSSLVGTWSHPPKSLYGAADVIQEDLY